MILFFNMKRLVIGVTGQPSSGKDTVAEHLASLGFLHISTSDLLREEMREKGLPTDRPSMHDFVLERRKENGQGYLAEKAIGKINGDSVVSGLRNTEEVNVLKKAFGNNFILLAIDAPFEVRYKWVLGRRRDNIELSFEEFKAEEEAERNANQGAFQVDTIIQMADKTIVNASSKEDLLRQVDSLVLELKKVI
jgi:dephospho-CoA kinase